MAELTIDKITQHILDVAKPLLLQADVDLIELKVGQHKRDVLIQITADKLTGGISIGECCTLNKAISAAIDAAGVIPEDCYSLDFSSPGLDRPLTTLKDFARNLNAAIELELKEAQEGKRGLTGILVSIDGQSLTMVIKKDKRVIIPLSNIIKGMLVI